MNEVLNLSSIAARIVKLHFPSLSSSIYLSIYLSNLYIYIYIYINIYMYICFSISIYLSISNIYTLYILFLLASIGEENRISHKSTFQHISMAIRCKLADLSCRVGSDVAVSNKELLQHHAAPSPLGRNFDLRCSGGKTLDFPPRANSGDFCFENQHSVSHASLRRHDWSCHSSRLLLHVAFETRFLSICFFLFFFLI